MLRQFRPLRLLGTAMLLLGIAGTVAAQAPAVKADPKRGEQVATQICAGCHGADGNSTISANPKLAGISAPYLLKQLNDYAKPPSDKTARVNPVMAGIVTALSAEDRVHVAAYYAAQEPKLGAARNKETLEVAQRIWRAGVMNKGVPACAGCHGPTGAGIPVLYPRLSGQHAEYTAAQLVAMRDGLRRNNEAMATIASRLSDAEIKALADYAAGLR